MKKQQQTQKKKNKESYTYLWIKNLVNSKLNLIKKKIKTKSKCHTETKEWTSESHGTHIIITNTKNLPKQLIKLIQQEKPKSNIHKTTKFS